MAQRDVIISPNKDLVVEVENGELVSFKFFEEELIHNKEQGWKSSDT